MPLLFKRTRHLSVDKFGFLNNWTQIAIFRVICNSNSRQVFEKLPFWVHWYRDLKEVLQFVRISTYREELVSQADQHGYLTTLLSRRPPSIAEWRWHLLKLVMDFFRAWMLIWQEVWTEGLFKGCRQAKLEKRARAIIFNARWCKDLRWSTT